MIIDIRYTPESGKYPEQIQNVRMFTTYTDLLVEGSIVCHPGVLCIHFKEYVSGMRHVNIADIREFTVTED